MDIKSKITFPKDYFQDEIRSDFTISYMMKRAWAATLEVLVVIDEICVANNIKYSVAFGTLLGAIRHKGFIPWDDDIDIVMLRDDYDRFIKIAPNYLPYGFVLAGMYSPDERLQNACFAPHSRVIADELKWNFNDYMKYFHGFPYQRVGIDIFPLDTVTKNTVLLEQQKKCYIDGIVLLRDWDKLKKAGRLDIEIDKIGKVVGVDIPRTGNVKNYIWRLLDALISLTHNEDSNLCTNMVDYADKNLYVYEKEWFDEIEYVTFEDIIKVPIPKEYHKILTATFHDYMTPVKWAADHEYPFYGHMEQELIKQIKAVGFEGSVAEFCDLVSSGQLTV